jgi:hypothetical protein
MINLGDIPSYTPQSHIQQIFKRPVAKGVPKAQPATGLLKRAF